MGGPPVRVLGEQGAETDGHRHVVVLGQADDLIAEAAPLHRRLRSDDEQHVGRRERRRPHVDRRPDDLAVALVDDDERTHGGEVGERLRIELGDLGGVPVLGEHTDRPGRPVAGIVPAGEAEQQHRSAQLQVAEQPDVFHRCSPYGRR